MANVKLAEASVTGLSLLSKRRPCSVKKSGTPALLAGALNATTTVTVPIPMKSRSLLICPLPIFIFVP